VKCLVSGATGFIGRQLCRQLSARGDTLVALSKSGGLLEDGAPTLAVDLAVEDPDAESFRGVDVVIHLAGIAHQQAADSAYEKLNYEATLRLARLARTAGVGCFIFLSSVKAMGASCSANARLEDDCCLPLDTYGLSKWHAECALREEFRDSEMSVVILRPALVYGINAKGNLQRLAAAVHRGLPRPPAMGLRSMIALQDLVDLLCHLALDPPSGVHTWIACGEQAYSTRAIYDLLREANGQRRGVGWMPLWAWRSGAWLQDQLTGATTERTFDKLFGTEIYSCAAVQVATGWQPRVALENVVDALVGGLASKGKPGS
jgi:nucleoside-diphosphate-sugar epimerase